MVMSLGLHIFYRSGSDRTSQQEWENRLRNLGSEILHSTHQYRPGLKIQAQHSLFQLSVLCFLSHSLKTAPVEIQCRTAEPVLHRSRKTLGEHGYCDCRK